MPNSTSRSAARKEKLKNRGYRITSARSAVMDVLGRTREHLSAGDIYLQLHSSHPGIGLTTVYRTLELCSGLGLVVKLDFGDGRSRYELAEKLQGENHHHHLICTRCNKIIDYKDFHPGESDLLSAAQKELSERYHFVITNHLMQFYGLCSRCAGKE